MNLPMTMQVLSADQIRRHGGNTDFVWDDVGSVYPCDLQPVEASKQIGMLQLGIQASGKLFWDSTQVVIADDSRIKIDGEVYKLSTNSKVTPSQRPGWFAKAFVMEARL